METTTSVSEGLTSCTWKVEVATSGSCSHSTVSSATRPMYSLCSRSMTRLARARSSHTSPGEEMKNCSFLTFRLWSISCESGSAGRGCSLRSRADDVGPVSYTHLTLQTSDLV